MRKQKLKPRKEKLQMRMNNLKKITQLKTATIIDSNKFNYKNKIVEFKYVDIKDLVNNIKNNTISEIDVKKDLNK